MVVVKMSQKKPKKRKLYPGKPLPEPLPVYPERQMAQNASEFRGTSRGDMPNVLRASDAAKLVQCPECGHSAGRHSRNCPRKEAS